MKFLFTIILSFLFQFAFGQLTSLGEPRSMTRKEEITDSVNEHCIHRNKINSKQRINNFPFNQAKEVRLVSFKKRYGIGLALPMKNKKVDLSKLSESFTLDKINTDSLTDILYNTGYKGLFYSFSDGCYEPRNAILFIDSLGQSFAFIELCFQCDGFRLSSKKVKAGQFCNEKYELLKSFFIKNRIVYGTRYID